MSLLLEKSIKHKGAVTFFSSVSEEAVGGRDGKIWAEPSRHPQLHRGDPRSPRAQRAGNVGADSGQLKSRFLLN